MGLFPEFFRLSWLAISPRAKHSNPTEEELRKIAEGDIATASLLSKEGLQWGQIPHNTVTVNQITMHNGHIEDSTPWFQISKRGEGQVEIQLIPSDTKTDLVILDANHPDRTLAYISDHYRKPGPICLGSDKFGRLRCQPKGQNLGPEVFLGIDKQGIRPLERPAPFIEETLGTDTRIRFIRVELSSS